MGCGDDLTMYIMERKSNITCARLTLALEILHNNVNAITCTCMLSTFLQKEHSLGYVHERLENLEVEVSKFVRFASRDESFTLGPFLQIS